MSMVDRAGRKPHSSSSSICRASQKSLSKAIGDDLQQYFAGVGDE